MAAVLEFKANEKLVAPPTLTQIGEMKKKGAKISERTIYENTYRAVIRAVTENSGSCCLSLFF